MGQSFRCMNLDKREYLVSYDYDCGAKMMEHSWCYNEYVAMVLELLSPTGHWHGDRIVWVGQYDRETFIDAFDPNYEYGLFAYSNEHFTSIQPKNTLDFSNNDEPPFRYLFNHTKKEYLDLDALPVSEVIQVKGKDVFKRKVFPLSILTAIGNGLGSGDYRLNSGDESYVGRWAGDSISLSSDILDGYQPIQPNFIEH